MITHEAKRFPRVLIVAQDSIARPTSYGIWTSSLFASWPAGELGQLIYRTGEFTGEHPIPTVELYRTDLRVVGPMLTIRNRLRRGRSVTVAGSPSASFSPAAGRVRWIPFLDMVPFRIPRRVKEWVTRFSPDLIYSPMASVRQIRLVASVAKLARAPIFVYFHDDWLGTLYNQSVLHAIPRAALTREFRKTLRGVRGAGATSEAMANAYEHVLTPIPCSPFIRCVPSPPSPPPVPLNGGRSLTLTYAGGLHLDRWRSLTEIGHALEELRSDGISAHLDVYAPDEDVARFGDALRGRSSVRLCGFRPQHELASIIDRSDVLVHVESFEPAFQRYTKYSLSTKIPEYMSRGRPLFGYGPSTGAALRYIESTGAGVAVGEQSRRQLVHALRSLLASPATRQSMGAAAWRAASTRHDPQTVREEFRAALAAASRDATETALETRR
jgi:glycosyltransferase involved in cell wall biosynthesis